MKFFSTIFNISQEIKAYVTVKMHTPIDTHSKFFNSISSKVFSKYAININGKYASVKSISFIIMLS